MPPTVVGPCEPSLPKRLGGENGSLLQLPAQRLGELLAVIERVPRVDAQPVVKGESTAFSVFAIASEVYLCEVLQHVERAGTYRRKDRE